MPRSRVETGDQVRLPRVRLNQFAYAKLLARKVGGHCWGWSQSIRKNRRFTAGFCHDRNALSPCPRAPFPSSPWWWFQAPILIVWPPADRSCYQAEPDRTRSTGHSSPLLAEFAVQVFVNLETTDLVTTGWDGQRDGNWTQCTAGLTDSRLAVRMLRPVGMPGNTRNPNTRILQCRSVVCCLHASAHQITRQVPDATSLLLATGCDCDRRPIFQRVRLPSFAIPIQLCFHDTPKVPKFLPPPPSSAWILSPGQPRGCQQERGKSLSILQSPQAHREPRGPRVGSVSRCSNHPLLGRQSGDGWHDAFDTIHEGFLEIDFEKKEKKTPNNNAPGPSHIPTKPSNDGNQHPSNAANSITTMIHPKRPFPRYQVFTSPSMAPHLLPPPPAPQSSPPPRSSLQTTTHKHYKASTAQPAPSANTDSRPRRTRCTRDGVDQPRPSATMSARSVPPG